ncbi:MAG: hypothetical protein J0L93_07970 [Deltaproteobacteria bacterium]|nr:hypothetical protein [Deltaproteobacteria bacterium]
MKNIFSKKSKVLLAMATCGALGILSGCSNEKIAKRSVMWGAMEIGSEEGANTGGSFTIDNDSTESKNDIDAIVPAIMMTLVFPISK